MDESGYRGLLPRHRSRKMCPARTYLRIFYSGIYCDHIEDIVVFHPSLAAHRLTQRYGNLRRPFQEWENEIVEV